MVVRSGLVVENLCLFVMVLVEIGRWCMILCWKLKMGFGLVMMVIVVKWFSGVRCLGWVCVILEFIRVMVMLFICMVF